MSTVEIVRPPLPKKPFNPTPVWMSGWLALVWLIVVDLEHRGQRWQLLELAPESMEALRRKGRLTTA